MDTDGLTERCNTTPERHRKIVLADARAGKSINAWVDAALAAARELADPHDD